MRVRRAAVHENDAGAAAFAPVQVVDPRAVDHDGNTVQRKVYESELSADAAEKGLYAHYMLTEIHVQPRAVAQTLEARVAGG